MESEDEIAGGAWASRKGLGYNFWRISLQAGNSTHRSSLHIRKRVVESLYEFLEYLIHTGGTQASV